MKKIISLLLCFIIVFPITVSAISYNNESGIVILSETKTTEGGFTCVDKLIDISQSRSSDRTYLRKKSLYNGDNLIADIAFPVTFRYDGSSVSVVSKAVTQTDTYNGWNYKQNSFTSSGGTVTLDAKLTKLLLFNVPFTMSATCDANGNISIS